MKYTVKVNGELLKVEIRDLTTRPVIAIVDGEQFEVWPEETLAVPVQEPKAQPAERESSILVSTGTAAAPLAGLDAKSVRAPIPGVIVEVLVSPGDAIEYGQPLLTIEAMKMRNKIRAARAGTIAEICVTVGQTVNYNEQLLKYTD